MSRAVKPQNSLRESMSATILNPSRLTCGTEGTEEGGCLPEAEGQVQNHSWSHTVTENGAEGGSEEGGPGGRNPRIRGNHDPFRPK